MSRELTSPMEMSRTESIMDFFLEKVVFSSQLFLLYNDFFIPSVPLSKLKTSSSQEKSTLPQLYKIIIFVELDKKKKEENI